MKFINFDLKWVIIIILTGLLGISILYNPTISPADEKSIIGTYNSAPDYPNQGEYVVFEENDKVCRYMQLEGSNAGTFYQKEENIFILTFEETKVKTTAIFCGEIMYLCEGEQVKKYEKISDVPTYIGID